MRTLHWLTHRSCALPLSLPLSLPPALNASLSHELVSFTCDAASHRLYLFTRCHHLLTIDLTAFLALSSTNVLTDTFHENDSITSFQHVAEVEGLFLVSPRGAVMIYQPEGNVMTSIGAFDDGLLAAEWSPDRELLALFTRSHRLVLLTAEGNVLHEEDIVEDGQGVISGHVLAPVNTLLKPKGHIEAERERAATLCWRVDSQFFALSCYEPRFDFRRIRVFTREGLFSSQSFPFPCPLNERTVDLGLNSPLAWSPNGALLATSHRRQIGRSHVNEIVFFEKNGLRHGEFTLASYEIDEKLVSDIASAERASDASVLELQWNSDSDVLAVRVQDLQTQAQSVELYSQSNYRWSRHHSFHLAPFIRFMWHPESPLTLLLVTADDKESRVHSLSFAWDYIVSHSDGKTVDKKWICVHENASLKLTPLALTVIPPPMSFSHLQLPLLNSRRGCVRAVTFTPIGSLVTLLSDGQLIFLHSLDMLQHKSEPQMLSSLRVPHTFLSLKEYSIAYENVRSLIVLNTRAVSSELIYRFLLVRASQSDEASDELLELTVSCVLDSVSSKLLSQHVHSLKGVGTQHILRTYLSTSHDRDANEESTVFLQCTDGSLHLFDWASNFDGGKETPFQQVAMLPAPCPWFAACRFGNSSTLSFIGRDRRSRLFCDDVLLTPQCSSFSLSHPRFFAFTIVGAQHASFFIDRQRTLAESMSLGIRNDPHAVRFIEKGAVIITMIPAIKTPRVIMQMPRGNLEVVYPRALTLASISQALQQQDYATAFETARFNRIDLNLLVDHDLSRFLLDAELMVTQIADVDRINLLISSLEDRDVIAEEFPHYQRINAMIDANQTDHATDFNSYSDANLVSSLHKNTTRREAKSEQRKVREQEALQYEEQLQQQANLHERMKNKVNACCETMRIALKKVDSVKYRLCILTSFVRQKPPRLEDALNLVQSLKDDALGTSLSVVTVNGIRSIESLNEEEHRLDGAEGALKYVIFLCDTNSLYTVALGLYNRDLALMVAKYARMDPKEYMPIVNDLLLSTRSALLTQYRVDCYLKRWSKAVVALIKAIEQGEAETHRWVEILKLCSEHKVWHDALNVCRLSLNNFAIPQSGIVRSSWGAPSFDYSIQLDRQRSLLHAYADFLREDLKPVQASTAYILSGDFDKALRCYLESGQWRLALSLAYQLNLENEVIRSLAFEFISLFKDSKSHAVYAKDVSRLLIELGEDMQEACNVLCMANEWDEALYSCQSQGRPDLLVSQILPEADAYAERVQISLKRRRDKYIQACKRLRVIRRVKLMLGSDRAMAELRGEDVGEDAIEDDLQSIVSGVSGIARYSSSNSESGESGMSVLTSASVGSAFSVFSLASSTSPENETSDVEKRKADRLARKKDHQLKRQSKKRIKEGSVHEEAGLLDIIRDCRLGENECEQINRSIRFLMSQGRIVSATHLQTSLASFIAIQQTEEATHMPLLSNMSIAQREALLQFWDWPRCVQEDRSKRIVALDRAGEFEFVGFLHETDSSKTNVVPTSSQLLTPYGEEDSLHLDDLNSDSGI